MKLQSVNTARSVWLFPTADLNPKGKSLVPILYHLTQRYKFTRYPAIGEQKADKEIKLENGQFTGTTGEAISVELTLFSDGVVADTRASTDDSDSFLHDVLTWLCNEHGFLDYGETKPKKIYVSELFVTCEQSLGYLTQALADFRGEVARHDFGYGRHPIEVTGMVFGPDPQNTTLRSFTFTFERVLNVPFAQNRYFSSSPFRTETHLDFLNKLEKFLSSL